MRTKLKQAKNKNEIVLALIFVLIFLVFSLISKHFFTLTNVMGLFSQMVELGLLTLAMAASMLSGGMDLSISAICSLCTVMLGVFIGRVGMPDAQVQSRRISQLRRQGKGDAPVFHVFRRDGDAVIVIAHVHGCGHGGFHVRYRDSIQGSVFASPDGYISVVT